MKDKCYFSTNIGNGLTCSKHPLFDDFGFPIIDCGEYPCKKFQQIVKELEADRKNDNQISAQQR